MKVFKYFFAITPLLAATHSFAFTYNQPMISFQGGVISQLNNCGVYYTENGKFLRGQTNLAAKLQSDQSDITSFYNLEGGVVAQGSNGIFFSPDGTHLDGGGRSIKIEGKGKLFATKHDVVTIDTLITQVNPFQKVGIQNITVIKDAALPNKTITTYRRAGPADQAIRILGEFNGTYFLQDNIGNIYSTKNLLSLNNNTQFTLLHSRAPNLTAIVPYQNGFAAYTPSSIYWSNNPFQVITGQNVILLHNGPAIISSIVNYGGEATTNPYTSGGSTKGLLVTTTDGNAYFSPDGTNALGGGRSFPVMKPIDVIEAKTELANYLKQIQQNDPFFVPSPGSQISLNRIDVRLLNKGESTEFSNDWFALNEGESYVSGMISDFAGKTAKLDLFDRGWYGFEYKWRFKGAFTGIFDGTTKGQIVGQKGFKVTPQSSCAVVTALQNYAYPIDEMGFAFSFKLNSDLSIAYKGGNQQFKGRLGFPNYYPASGYAYAGGELGWVPVWEWFYPQNLASWIPYGAYKVGQVIPGPLKNAYHGTPAKVLDILQGTN